MDHSKTLARFDLAAALRHAVDLLSQSSNAQDLCRRVTHAEIFSGFCRGAAIYLLDQRSNLVQVASYGGAIADDSQVQISAWDGGFLSDGIRSRLVTFEPGSQELRACLPIEVAGVVNGAVLMSFSPETPKVELDRADTRVLANLVGLFMDNKGSTFTKAASSQPSGNESEDAAVQELTTRQVQILHYVADGLTNAEISKHVLLSESTVRQETIRIFRVLKCHTRSEAIVKARASGIIARVPNVNAPVLDPA